MISPYVYPGFIEERFFNKKLPKALPALMIIKTVIEYFNLEEGDLSRRDRHRKICYPRHVAMYLLNKKTGLTLGEIGRMFTRKIGLVEVPMDHTTVIHARQTIENLMENNPNVRDDIQKIISSLY